MSMDHAAAERWVTISAVGVAGMYAYRRMIEPTTSPPTIPEIVGVGELPQLGAWATAWGFTFLVVAIMAEASPEFGGAFAILILVAAVMANATSLFADVGKQEQGASSTAKAPVATTAAKAPTTKATPTDLGSGG